MLPSMGGYATYAPALEVDVGLLNTLGISSTDYGYILPSTRRWCSLTPLRNLLTHYRVLPALNEDVPTPQ
jgi:hypothetical protein